MTVPLVESIRHELVAPAAGLTVYAIHAGVDWDWQLPVVTVAALALAAQAVASEPASSSTTSRASSSIPWMNVDFRRRSTGKPEHVETGALHDAAVVTEPSLRVDHRHVEPRVVGAEPRRPDDRADLAAAEIEREPRRLRHLGRGEALAGVASGPLVEPVEQPLQLEVGQGEDVSQATREERASVADGCQAPDQLDAERGQRVQIERRRAVPTSCGEGSRRARVRSSTSS